MQILSNFSVQPVVDSVLLWPYGLIHLSKFSPKKREIKFQIVNYLFAPLYYLHLITSFKHFSENNSKDVNIVNILYLSMIMMPSIKVVFFMRGVYDRYTPFQTGKMNLFA